MIMDNHQAVEEKLQNEDQQIYNSEKYLIFNVGNETFGIPVKKVREVIEYCKIFVIPSVPDYIAGVINLRGDVIPVIDLTCRFYGYKCDKTILTSIVFIEIEYNDKIVEIGIIIDEIRSVVDIYDNDLEAIPDFAVKIRADYIQNIGKVRDDFVILLDVDRVLDIGELSRINPDK
jgi:purine-binding chemotaxis protein CheW